MDVVRPEGHKERLAGRGGPPDKVIQFGHDEVAVIADDLFSQVGDTAAAVPWRREPVVGAVERFVDVNAAANDAILAGQRVRKIVWGWRREHGGGIRRGPPFGREAAAVGHRGRRLCLGRCPLVKAHKPGVAEALRVRRLLLVPKVAEMPFPEVMSHVVGVVALDGIGDGELVAGKPDAHRAAPRRIHVVAAEGRINARPLVVSTGEHRGASRAAHPRPRVEPPEDQRVLAGGHGIEVGRLGAQRGVGDAVRPDVSGTDIVRKKDEEVGWLGLGCCYMAAHRHHHRHRCCRPARWQPHGRDDGRYPGCRPCSRT
mmetsp:Transcript_17500/g.45751  ORF Transcript_17500/g.45751 Transcript_17500/m.45751 type:complete len:314 (+) Transcript_17500:809-1750(+)